MPKSDKIFKQVKDLNGANLRVGVVMSLFNSDISERLFDACRSQLIKMGVEEQAISLVTVAGALETPLVAQKLAQEGFCDVLIALGCIIRGETYHFEIVANESARGMMEVQLHTGIPIINAILTTETEQQAKARAEEKGTYAAQVAIETANLIKSISS